MGSDKLINLFWSAAFFGWTVLLLIASVIPTTGLEPEGGSKSDFRWDYPLHFIVFLILPLLFIYWRNSTGAGNRKRELTWFLLAGTIYAGFTEVIQLFIEGRSFNPVDLLYNILGVITGTILAYLIFLRPKEKQLTNQF
jgi:VanZ family protein